MALSPTPGASHLFHLRFLARTSKIDDGFHVSWLARASMLLSVLSSKKAIQGDKETGRRAVVKPLGADSEGPSVPDATVVFLESGAVVSMVSRW